VLTQESLKVTAAAAVAAVKSILKQSSIPPIVIDSTTAANDQHDEEDDEDDTRKNDNEGSSPSHKKNLSDKKHHHHHHRKPTAEEPMEVRVLNILKKHAELSRPLPWQVKEITISKSKAMEELRELLAILKEVQESSRSELRAMFEELARMESDCSSAKRGGDLGFFGKS
jgi:NIMA-interacting peptidyl-prolyl cis-trans isomerase 1